MELALKKPRTHLESLNGLWEPFTCFSMKRRHICRSADLSLMASHSNAKLCKRLFAPFRQYLLARLELFAPQIVQFTGAITSFRANRFV